MASFLRSHLGVVTYVLRALRGLIRGYICAVSGLVVRLLGGMTGIFGSIRGCMPDVFPRLLGGVSCILHVLTSILGVSRSGSESHSESSCKHEIHDSGHL